MKNIVSVVIPVYNAGNKIIKCVESLLFGKYEELQVILVDDCSCDDSWHYCMSLSKKYDKVIAVKNEKNSGVSFTRNRGLELADSKYVVFVDSDDWVSSNYLSKLVESIEKHPDSLSICGICFIDEINGDKRDYLWPSNEKELQIKKEKYFSLVDSFFIQSPCNKIFDISIIKKNKIQFDVNQSMGEDFQFVLDYLQCLNSDYCVVINETLYYYIRYSNTSLMGSFGLKEKNYEFIKRLSQLYNIINIDSKNIKQSYKRTLNATLNSYVYNICRNNNISDKEKCSLIEYIMQNNMSLEYFKKQKKQIRKENLVKKIISLKKVNSKIKYKFIDLRNKMTVKKIRKKLNNSDFTIISQNCIGGVIYNDLNLKFLSPTINLYFTADDFVKLVLNLNYYLNLDITMKWLENYPIGVLDDVIVHFMHYQTCSEAKDAWNRRKERVNYNKILVVSTDMEGFNEYTFKEWKKITYPKVLLASKKWDDESCIYFDKYSIFPNVPDLIPNRDFYKNDKLIQKINSL